VQKRSTRATRFARAGTASQAGRWPAARGCLRAWALLAWSGVR
jgi:hypothetical protein